MNSTKRLTPSLRSLRQTSLSVQTILPCRQILAKRYQSPWLRHRLATLVQVPSSSSVISQKSSPMSMRKQNSSVLQAMKCAPQLLLSRATWGLPSIQLRQISTKRRVTLSLKLMNQHSTLADYFKTFLMSPRRTTADYQTIQRSSIWSISPKISSRAYSQKLTKKVFESSSNPQVTKKVGKACETSPLCSIHTSMEIISEKCFQISLKMP